MSARRRVATHLQRSPELVNLRESLLRGLMPLLAPALVACLFLPGYARAEIVHGDGDFMRGSFDFGEQIVPADPYTADVGLIHVFFPFEAWFVAGIQAWIKVVPDSSLSSLTTAPADTSDYDGWEAPVLVGVTYVAKTFDGYYAKFALSQWIPWGVAEFEYYVQLDGSTNLATPVATHPTTWGRVKALYSR